MKLKENKHMQNKIPDGWINTNLGGTITLNYGKGLSGQNRMDGGVPVYGSSGITGYHDKPYVNEPGYIIGRKGTVGSVYYSSVPFYPIDTTYYITRKDAKCDFDFLYFLLKYLKLDQLNTDSAVPGLNRENAYSQQVLLPTPNDQIKIAKILYSFDNKIELLKEQNKTLESIAQTIFKEWFVKFNFPGSTGKMIDSELGPIPEGWISGVLNDYIDELESGKRPKGGVGQLKSGIPSVGAESINGITQFDFSKTKYISVEFFNKMNTGKVKNYDILVYKDGGAPGTFLPRFTITGESFPFTKFAINEHVFRVRTKNENQLFFLYMWLNSFYCKRELQNIGSKAAIPGINSTDFRNISLLRPSEQILMAYHLAVSSSFKKILINNSQIQNLSKARDMILPKLMRGDIKVKSDQKNI